MMVSAPIFDSHPGMAQSGALDIDGKMVKMLYSALGLIPTLALQDADVGMSGGYSITYGYRRISIMPTQSMGGDAASKWNILREMAHCPSLLVLPSQVAGS